MVRFKRPAKMACCDPMVTPQDDRLIVSSGPTVLGLVSWPDHRKLHRPPVELNLHWTDSNNGSVGFCDQRKQVAEATYIA